jgi:hypothetical protein
VQLERLRAAPHLDDDRRAGRGDAAGLAERRDHVVGEEERVEAADGVEAVVGVGELLQVALGEIGLGHALAGDGEELLRGVEPARSRAVVGGDAQEGAAAAADVEHGVARADLGTADRRPIGGGLLGLHLAPVLGAHAPGPAVAVRAGGSSDRHLEGTPPVGDKLRLIAINYGR